MRFLALLLHTMSVGAITLYTNRMCPFAQRCEVALIKVVPVRRHGTGIAPKQKGVKAADVSIARTELVDKYLDGDVNWLNEIRRLAAKVPESDKLIVRSVSGVSDSRNGGGTLTVEGAVTKPAVIEEFEDAIRDDFRNTPHFMLLLPLSSLL